MSAREVADHYCPHDPDLAIAAGRRLCEELLEPLQAAFGRIEIRSAYRSPEVNDYGARHYPNSASNEHNAARHIWDQRDKNGCMGATACIVVPSFWDRHQQPGDWQKLAWWMHDDLPYSEMHFFPKLWAFNLNWHERPVHRIKSDAEPKGVLTARRMANHTSSHREHYEGFPSFRTGMPAVNGKSVSVHPPEIPAASMVAHAMEEWSAMQDRASVPEPLDEKLFWSRLREMMAARSDHHPLVFRRGPGNLRVKLPREGTWVTAYRAPARENAIGAFFRMAKEPGVDLWPRLMASEPEIRAILPRECVWEHNSEKERYTVWISKPLPKFETDEQQLHWLADHMGQFINAFWPRVS